MAKLSHREALKIAARARATGNRQKARNYTSIAKDISSSKRTKRPQRRYLDRKTGRVSHTEVGSETHVESFTTDRYAPLNEKQAKQIRKIRSGEPKGIIVPKQTVKKHGKVLYTIEPGEASGTYIQTFPVEKKYTVTYGKGDGERTRTFDTEALAKKYMETIKAGILEEAHRLREATTIIHPLPKLIPPITKKPIKLPSFKSTVSSIGKIGDAYEGIFKRLIKPLDTSIKRIQKETLEQVYKGNTAAGFGLYLLGGTAKATRGVVNGITFVVRPAAWKRTADTVSLLLTPEKGETTKEYQVRVKAFISGDIADPNERDRITKEILKTIPDSPVKITPQALEQAKLFKQAMAEEIMKDPTGFLAEVVGGLAGGYIAGKAIQKLPVLRDRLTVRSLEQRMWDKITPIEEIGTTVPEVHSVPGEWGPNLMPKGTYRATWKIARDVLEKGGTAIVMLRDPLTGNPSGFMSWVEVVEITGGIPEALGSIGALTAVPVIIETGQLSKQVLKEIQKAQPVPAYYDKFKQEKDRSLIILPAVELGITTELDTLTQQIHDLINEQILQGGPDQTIEQIQSQIRSQINDSIDQQDTVLDVDQIQDQIQNQIQEQLQEHIQEQVQETSGVPVGFIPLPLTKDEEKRLKDIPKARLGRRGKYKITLQYIKGASKIKIVTASNYIEAISKGVAGSRKRVKLEQVDAEKIGR